MGNNFVSPAWLASATDDGGICVLDASWHMPASGRQGRHEYAQRRIPGAVFFDIDAFADPASDLPHMLPSAEVFSEATAALGISTDSHLVVYDSVGLFSAPRAWWMFKSFGHDGVSVLAGGLPAWERAGLSLETGMPGLVSPGRGLDGAWRHGWIAEIESVTDALVRADAVVIDARSPGRFSGSDPEPRPGLSSGHMPGAVNMPFQCLIDESSGELLPADQLYAAFEALGVRADKEIITTCGSGVSACILALALDEIGLSASVYDGSWCEWATRMDASMIATGDEP